MRLSRGRFRQVVGPSISAYGGVPYGPVDDLRPGDEPGAAGADLVEDGRALGRLRFDGREDVARSFRGALGRARGDFVEDGTRLVRVGLSPLQRGEDVGGIVWAGVGSAEGC
jgi:hypothetical protein